MKYLTLSILTASLMSCDLFDQDISISKVPSVVKNAFATEFSNPVDVEWEKKKRNFEVDFEIGDVDFSALYNPDGQLLMSKQDIEEADLPSSVTGKIAEEFPDRYIDDVDKVEKEGNVFYQVELDGQPRDRKVIYTADGQQDNSFKYWD